MKNSYSKLLSVIVPCYNEQNTIGKVVLVIKKALKISKIHKYEIIIINDASKDKTKNIIKKIKIKNKSIKIINNYKNLGLGASVMKAYRYANGNIVRMFQEIILIQ